VCVSEVKKSEIIERAQALLAEKPFSKQNEAEFKSLMLLHDAMEETENEKADEDALSRINAARRDMGVAGADLRSNSHKEQRAALYAYVKSGETRSYVGLNTTIGSSGGFLIPADYQRELFLGIAQYSDLLNQNNVNLIRTPTGSPVTLPGFDLSSISSSVIGQGTDNPPSGAPPVITRNILNGFTYKTVPVVSSLEIEMDAFESIWSILSQAFSVGIARGCGADLVNGNGTTAPQGILTAAANSGVTSTVSGVWSGIDLAAVYASVNRAYRVSPKCAWLMHDTTYQQIVALKDANSRPLLGIRDDAETLFGKRVLISPDMPVGAGAKSIVFGDLSQFVVRVAGNSVTVRRSFEVPGMAEQGVAQYTGYARIDANLIAPNGVKPVVYATAHV
jgi:HK97 family phage major capsid protein